MLNYIGVFLTFRCNLGCNYCLNHVGDFTSRPELTADEWLDILQNVRSREDLPITLQGGEPTLHPYFYDIVQKLHAQGHYLDLLTNGYFNIDEFLAKTTPEMFKRRAPYASIRFSCHKNTNEIRLLIVVKTLKSHGYSVGIWGIDHPDMKDQNDVVAWYCGELGIDFRMKEFLGAMHGTYKYPDAVTGKKNILVRCYPSELLYAPDGAEFPCHRFLYKGSLLPGITEVADGYVICHDYGLCNPCDIKLKTNRLQEGGHCSVRIEKL
jgi:hypothetical protein